MKWFKKILVECYFKVLEVITILKIKLALNSTAQLEIGSGGNKREGWLTMDMAPGADLFWDLRNKLPFRDSSFERIYCSHVLEHFAYNDLRSLLIEVLRVLRPGGKFLIAVPDASIYIDAYLGRRNGEQLLRYKPAVISPKAMDILNYMFYMDGNHRFMFDSENIKFHCEMAGFVDCTSRTFDPSLDMSARNYESLYFSCCKPTNKGSK